MRGVFAAVGLVLTGVVGALMVAAPAIEAGGGGHGCGQRPREGRDEPVAIRDNCFTPAVLYVEPGSEVEWRSEDAVQHNVTLLDGEVVGGDATLYEGDSVSRRFESAGVFAYYCTVHPSMLGVVVVGDPADAASISSQSIASQSVAASDVEKGSASIKGKGENAGDGSWREVAVGLGLAGGLAVGLVVVGGGMRFRRLGR